MRAILNANEQNSYFRAGRLRSVTLRAELLEPRYLLSADALFSIGATSLALAGEHPSPRSLDFPLQAYATDIVNSSLRHSDDRLLAENTVVKDLVAKPSMLDLGDDYWADGQQISLQRRSDQFVIGFTSPHLAHSLSTERIAELDAIQFDGWTKVSDIVPGISIWEVSSPTTSVFESEVSEAFLSVFDREEVQWTSPVFIEPEGGLRIVASNETIVALERDIDPALFFSTDTFSTYRPLLGTPDQFVATLASGGGSDTLRLTRELDQMPGVVFASPNFLSEIQFHGIPNDPSFSSQWHLQNTGQWGAKPGADAKLTTAWDTTTGSQEIVIAILDDGVQTNHPDLAANIWVNPYEIAGNGIDDDGNGWIDDVHGMNTTDSTNDPNPTHYDQNHGTSVAGVAAARGNNNLGVAGAAYNTKIMPLKIGLGVHFTTSAIIAQAVYYAAGRTADGQGAWRGADIANSSWGGGSPDTTLTSAFNWAAINGRGGLGLAHFVSTGNSASGYRQRFVTGVFPGIWQFEWEFSKDGSVSHGEDTAWLANISFPDGEVERIDSASLPGWTTGSASPWSIVESPDRTYGTGRFSLKAAPIGHNQSSWVRSPLILVESTSELNYQLWVSSESAYDGVRLYASYFGGQFVEVLGLTSGVPEVTPNVLYPANLQSTIAVGASTDWDYRSDYSHYGSALDFVAPSNGGYQPIATTDRTGSAGYSTDDYAWFGGTSSASPLAAGIGALLLSKNPNLTAAQIRQAMRQSADKIGGVTYSSGFNQYYGHGRVNATAALALVNADTSGPIVDDSVFDPTTFSVPVFSALFNERTVWKPSSVTVRAPDGTAIPFVEFGSGTSRLDIGLPQLTQNGVYSVVLSGVSPTTAFKDQAGNRINGGQSNMLLNFTYGSTSPTGDFNGDGLYNIADIDALVTAIAAGTHNTLYDLTGDGLVNLADRNAWLATAGAINLGPGRAYKAGDGNLDGAVDGSDFGIWNANKFTIAALWSKADFDANGVVDGSDFGVWNINKFTSSDGAMRQLPPQLPVLKSSLSFGTERYRLAHQQDAVAKDAVMQRFCDEKYPIEWLGSDCFAQDWKSRRA